MKNLTLYSVFLFVLQTFFFTVVYSQIIITSDDYARRMNQTNNIVNYFSSDTSGLKSALDETGENKTWNLTGRTFTISDTNISIMLDKTSSSAPHQNSFSAATIVIQSYSYSKPNFTSWTYQTLSEEKLLYYGYVRDSAGTVTSKQTNSPGWTSRLFPTTYSSTWSWSSSVTSLSYEGGEGVGGTVSIDGVDLVDGYGIVITPEGSFPCLRLKSKTSIDFGIFTNDTYYYDFFDQDRTYARIKTNSTGEIPVSVTYYQPEEFTDIKSNAISAKDFQLLQNYPNPFNSSTKIQFDLPEPDHVKIEVLNSIGQKIETLLLRNMQKGRHSIYWDASSYSSGIYFYRIKTSNVVQIKKMLLVK